MIEVEVNKDIKEYSPKFIGPFTGRQAICLVVSGILSILAYNTIGRFLPKDLKMYVCFIFATPGILIGWVKIFGMPFEKFAKIYIDTQILSPAVRKYKTENTLFMPTTEEQAKMRKENKQRKKSVKKFNSKSKLKPEHIAYK